MRHLPIASFFESDQFERVDKPILPVLAVREAIHQRPQEFLKELQSYAALTHGLVFIGRMASPE